MLDRIVVKDFKSYRGEQTLGPLKSFTSVIGPNGAGKSNFMDAISFVLGVSASTMRSSVLKDLIYRSGRRRGDRKGKRKAEMEADEQDEAESDEDEGVSEGDEDDVELDGERNAWVMAVYIDHEDKEWTFQRTVTIAGTSEYKVNNKIVTYKAYNHRLERFNILVKAKNFLVFQGDVEQVASQSPKDLAKLIDQISGSLDLKVDYDRAAAELARATELSTNQNSRRKGVNQEIKQYKEMKREAERWDELNNQKEDAVVRQLLWKLYHIEQGIQANTEEIESKADHLRQLRKDHQKHDDATRAAKKDLARAQKDNNKQEKAVRARENDLEEARPELVQIQARIDHATRKIDKANNATSKIQRDLDPAQQKLDHLNNDLAAVQRALEQHHQDQRELQQQQGFELNDDDIDEYRTLRGQANSTAVTERAELNTRTHEETAIKDKLAAAQDALEVAQRKLDRLQAEEGTLQDRKNDGETKVRHLTAELNQTKQKHADLAARRVQTAQTEQELNEKLEEVYAKLQQANADRQESERDQKFKETLANLKRTFPGVKGRVVDLCKPTQTKYGLAVQTVLGRNIDSVVVDTEKTAIACIEYMRVQRAGQATFIPLETIQVTRVNDKYRNFAKGAHLAIDVINYDPSVERAMQHACGSALVCDTLEVAKHICYERGQEVKAVTLEGTVIHRSGLITGGTSTHTNKHFEEREVEGLRRREADLRAKLSEIFKTKPKQQVEDNLKLDITRLESELTIVRDDLASTSTKLNGIQAEIKTVSKTVKELKKQIDTQQKELDSLNRKQATLRQVVEDAEDEIFADFCDKIGVDNIREYEQKQLKVQQDGNASLLKFETQIKKLGHQIEFQKEQVEELEGRLASVDEIRNKEQANLDRETTDKATKEAELSEIEGEIDELKDKLAELQKVLDDKTAALEDVRKSGSKSAKVLDKALKEIAACNDAIEKLASERFAVYRRCKLDEIDLPLAEGSRSLDSVPIEEGVPDQQPMDVDGPEDETQQAARVNDYGVEADFDSLEEAEMDEGGEAMGAQLAAEVAKIEAELDKLSPNQKAIERLGDSETRLNQISGEFDDARKQVQQAREAFTELRKTRTELFNKAFSHIADKIDGVYKELTKGTAAPTGGFAYLSVDEREEPYLGGVTYHAMPPMKRFRDMDQLSGGEKTMAALALLFAIHSFKPSPFFVLDEVDAALDNLNVSRIARYVRQRASRDFQFIVISLKAAFYEKAEALVGIYRDEGSKSLTLDLEQYVE